MSKFDPAMQAYAASAIVLGLNLLLLANNTALSRAKSAEVINPEDTKLSKDAAVVYEEGNGKTARYKRAHRNALENIPLFLLTAMLLVMVGVSATTARILFGVFVAARLFHSVAYIGQWQPWRTVSFVIGELAQATILGLIGYYVFLA